MEWMFIAITPGRWHFGPYNATITIVEATALREGLMLARRKVIQKLMVEGDSKLVIQMARGEWTPPWHRS